MMGQYTLAFDPVIANWLLIVFAVIAVALFLVSLRGNIFKAFTRLIFAALLLVFLSQPQLVKENRKSLNDVALIAVDKSASEGFGKRQKTSQQALVHLQTELKKLAGIETRIIDVATGEKRETKVFETIEAALSDIPDSQRAGTILLTDGQVNDRPSNEFLKSSPFHVVLTGSKSDRDREIKIINSPGYSVIGETVILKFKIEDHNAKSSGTAIVKLNLPDGTTESQEVPVGEEQQWSLPVENAGQNIFELSVDPLKDELSLQNNRTIINVQGVRNRLHVLLVSGEPYPGARMWRDLLKADPGVDLVHFTILRSPDKIDMTPPNELSLIAFPFQELFERKLKDFDLIIMDRFSLNTVLPDYYFQNMKNYVRNGGALLEISGPSYSTPSSMYNTSLGQILPAAPSGPMMQSAFKPEITALGKTHPVTMPLTKISNWGHWLQQLQTQRVSGDILMTGIDGNPLLILDHVDKGRIAQMTSDQIWLWAHGYDGGGPTTELLRRIVHWLMKEPELDENALNVEVTDTNIHIRSRKIGNNTNLQVTNPDGSQQILQLREDADGWLSGDITNAKQGIYKFADETRQKIISLGDITTPEFSNIITTEENLSPFTKTSKGGMVWAEQHPDFQVKNSAPGSNSGGTSWIGMKRNNSSSLISSEMKPLLPPELMSFIGLLAGLFLWWNESRTKKRFQPEATGT